MTNFRSATTTSVSKHTSLLLFFCDTYLLQYDMYSEIHNIGDRATRLDFGIAPTSFSFSSLKMTTMQNKLAKKKEKI